MEATQKRVTCRFNLNNERDRAIYKALSESPLDMTRIIKDLLYDNLVAPKTTEAPAVDLTEILKTLVTTAPASNITTEDTTGNNIDIDEDELEDIDI